MNYFLKAGLVVLGRVTVGLLVGLVAGLVVGLVLPFEAGLVEGLLAGLVLKFVPGLVDGLVLLTALFVLFIEPELPVEGNEGRILFWFFLVNSADPSCLVSGLEYVLL